MRTAVLKNRLLLLPIGAVVVVVLSYGLVALSGASGRPNRPTTVSVSDPVTQPQPAAAGTAVGPVDTSETDTKIAFWQKRIKETPNSDSPYQYLGELFALKGRQTGDVAQYALAAQAFKKAIELFPGNVAARSDLAVNLVTLHQWKEAIAQGTQILQTDLRALGAVAVIGDASLEIGDIDTAGAAFETLRQKAPGPSVESRVARLNFLTGHTAEAIKILDDAATAAGSVNASSEEQAFYHYSAGEYRWNTGDIDGAEREYQAALAIFPNYYLAITGRGRVAFAKGDLDRAIDLYRAAVGIIPKPELLAYLGDVYAVKGDQASAEKQYQAVDFIVKLNEIQAQVFNREIVLFQATHRRDTAHAVKIAAAELEIRKDIYGYDAYAWALFNDGQAGDALAPARQAVSLGTQDPRLLYHLGMIEMTTGHEADGRAQLQAALTLNPAFDPLGVAAARQALGQ
jgi:tetratricopeptide (TPR) repeat protein